MKNNKGITLVALVITIIILIILTGISISIVLGQDGLINKAKTGAEKYQNAAVEEENMLDSINSIINSITTGNNNVVNQNEKKVKLADGTEVTLTSENIYSYIGQEVQYSCAGGGTWRIFYLDTTNKYGDGVDTVFIKRDFDENLIDGGSDREGYTDANGKTSMDKFNTLWKENSESIDERNERMSAYLLDSSNWEDYYNSTVANYAIGTPSIEMYFDSYNQWNGDTNPHSYSYSSDGTAYNFTDGDVLAGPSNIYMTPGEFWWVASPSTWNGGSSYIFVIRGNYACVGYNYSENFGICPVVSLK